MFTQNPINGADERLIEASWGLGEVVVAGRVIPDNFRIDRSGTVLDRNPGVKKIAIRAVADGGTIEEARRPGARRSFVPRRRPARTARRPGPALRGGLRTGARHRVGDRRKPALPAAMPRGDPRGRRHRRSRRRADDAGRGHRAGPVLRRTERARHRPHRGMFKERRFAAGETITMEGAGAAAFFVIDSGEATVTHHGKTLATLGHGDYFGEIGADRRRRTVGDGHRHDRRRVPRLDVLGVPPARAAQRHDRVEPAPDARETTAHRPGGLKHGRCSSSTGRAARRLVWKSWRRFGSSRVGRLGSPAQFGVAALGGRSAAVRWVAREGTSMGRRGRRVRFAGAVALLSAMVGTGLVAAPAAFGSRRRCAGRLLGVDTGRVDGPSGSAGRREHFHSCTDCCRRPRRRRARASRRGARFVPGELRGVSGRSAGRVPGCSRHLGVVGDVADPDRDQRQLATARSGNPRRCRRDEQLAELPCGAPARNVVRECVGERALGVGPVAG